MAKQLQARAVGIPVGYPAQMMPKRLLLNQCSQPPTNGSLKHKQNKLERVTKVAETLTRKLSSGAKFLKVGGAEKIFRYNFSVKEGEKLLKATRCCLSTTAGPIAGLIFISTDGVAFCSIRSILLSSPTGEFTKIPYKVSIPVGNIQRVNESHNMNEPSQKYLEIVTVDGFDFWFYGIIKLSKNSHVSSPSNLSRSFTSNLNGMNEKFLA